MEHSQASAKSAESAKTGTPAGKGSPSGCDLLAGGSRFKRNMTEDSLIAESQSMEALEVLSGTNGFAFLNSEFVSGFLKCELDLTKTGQIQMLM